MREIKIFSNPALRFLITFIGLFAAFYGFYLLYLGITLPGNWYSPFLAHHLNFIIGLRTVLIYSSAAVLHLAGFTTKIAGSQLMVPARHIIDINYTCLGFGVMSFFAAFVLAYPKKNGPKLWFLFTGILVIQLLNIIRFVLLALFWNSNQQRIIDHHTLFNMIIYLLIMVSLYFWVKDTNTAATTHEN